uniref:Uncharacterized protein n=1 Tax=Glossina austeni TaxID=7395 RepID=A0A1A9VH70_GLOAU
MTSHLPKAITFSHNTFMLDLASDSNLSEHVGITEQESFEIKYDHDIDRDGVQWSKFNVKLIGDYKGWRRSEEETSASASALALASSTLTGKNFKTTNRIKSKPKSLFARRIYAASSNTGESAIDGIQPQLCEKVMENFIKRGIDCEKSQSGYLAVKYYRISKNHGLDQSMLLSKNALPFSTLAVIEGLYEKSPEKGTTF